ncbi:MutL protein homolog 3 [Tanacetum coccineum]
MERSVYQLADNERSSLIPPAVLRVLNSKASKAGSGYIGSSFSMRFETKHDGCGMARVETVSCVKLEDGGGRRTADVESGSYTFPAGSILSKIKIQLGFGELVSEIRGTYAVYQTVTVITSLTFVVGTQENGPYGKVNGTAFSLPIIDGKITGFWGNSDKYLDCLGVFVANP